MSKETIKTETHYNQNVQVNGEYESIDIVQEENVIGRNAIKVKFFEERWRTPTDVVELLKKVIIVIEQNFIDEEKEGEKYCRHCGMKKSTYEEHRGFKMEVQCVRSPTKFHAWVQKSGDI